MLYLYSDLAYYNSYAIIAPFNTRYSAIIIPNKRRFNERMSSIRILVEHGFSLAFNL